MEIDLELIHDLAITPEFGKLLFGKIYFRDDCVVTKHRNELWTQIEWMAEYGEDNHGNRQACEKFIIRCDGTIMRMAVRNGDSKVLEHMPFLIT